MEKKRGRTKRTQFWGPRGSVLYSQRFWTRIDPRPLHNNPQLDVIFVELSKSLGKQFIFPYFNLVFNTRLLFIAGFVSFDLATTRFTNRVCFLFGQPFLISYCSSETIGAFLHNSTQPRRQMNKTRWLSL